MVQRIKITKKFTMSCFKNPKRLNLTKPLLYTQDNCLCNSPNNFQIENQNFLKVYAEITRKTTHNII